MKRLRATICLGITLAIVAGLVLSPSRASAQSGVLRRGAVPPGTMNDAPVLPEDSSVAPGVPSQGTLEIAPRVAAPPSPAAAPSPQGDATNQGNTGDDVSDAAGTADDAAHTKAAAQTPSSDDTAGLVGENRPYLGLAVQYILSRDPPSRTVQGLEVVSVDKGSPAALAGLKGRGQMTSVGETGATASNLMAPLNLIVMPLLKKSGSLGSSGDLIVAIDDKRVDKADALRMALDSDKPGDVIYLTIERALSGGKTDTMKVPVKLTAAKSSANDTTADADGSGSN
ncbi:MAG TPA: PDZ domain-containing protein [Candidatus Binataceae bacterium]|nr:PDZ domain-containing protein [Candidatus Binataceae bacterium]